MRTADFTDTRVLYLDPEGELVTSADQVNDLLSDAWSVEAQLVAIPVERLGADFFRLASGLAGAVLQKFVQYHSRVAIIGDIAELVAASGPLRDFVRESNRGRQVWFVDDEAALAARLTERG